MTTLENIVDIGIQIHICTKSVKADVTSPKLPATLLVSAINPYSLPLFLKDSNSLKTYETWHGSGKKAHAYRLSPIACDIVLRTNHAVMLNRPIQTRFEEGERDVDMGQHMMISPMPYHVHTFDDRGVLAR